MQVKHLNILLILFLFCLAACSQDDQKKALFEQPGYSFPYQLNEPAMTWHLPESLAEISGISYFEPRKLACVQDEEGIIFIFDVEEGVIENQVAFGKAGDYEAIEIVGEDAWILKSNGALSQVKNFQGPGEPNVTKYPTFLSRSNDTEGLAYDPLRKALLIACKGYPFAEGKESWAFKAVYLFDLESKLLKEDPFLLIDLDTLRHYMHYDAMTDLGEDILGYLDPAKGDKTFQPSGIAIHPVSGDMYILGSVGKLLLVFSASGKLKAIVSLSPMIFPQPEGICFSPDGRLYISNEGKGKGGTILLFEPQPGPTLKR